VTCRFLLPLLPVLAPLALAAQSPASCVRTDADTVALRGVLERRTYPGRPNYESVSQGDEAEAGFYLRLTAPLSVCPDSTSPDRWPIDGGDLVQLLLDQHGYDRLRPSLGKRITLRGVLAEGYSGHHHTAFLLAVEAPRYLIYLHGRIIEEQGRRPTDPAYGTYEYDAILDSLGHAGFEVLSEQRPPKTDSDAFARHVAGQVDSLLALGVPPRAITVIGFSKGGWIAILASAKLQNSAVSFVFMGACGPWAFDKADLHVAGRMLSLFETSDSLGVSCAPMFARRSAGSEVREIALSLGKGHGTFFQPRSAWLDPAVAWAAGRQP